MKQIKDLEQLVVAAAHLMNDKDFQKWTGLCSPDFEYSVTAHSEELDKKVVWMERNKDDLAVILDSVDQHVTDPGELSRQIGPLLLVSDSDPIKTESGVVVWHTDALGSTKLFAVGKYIDEFVECDGTLKFSRREVALQTRRFPTGSHLPL